MPSTWLIENLIKRPVLFILLVALSAHTAGAGDQDSTVPDVHQIVESSVGVTQRHWQARIRYSYLECDEDRHLDSDGRVKTEDIELSRTILVNGVPFERVLERNGLPLSSEEQKRQREKLDKLMRETPGQRAERLRKEEEENTLLVREVSKAFDFQLLGEDVINERPAWILQATPRAGYRAQGKYGKMLSKVEGKLWVDKQDLGWIKVDGHVIQPLSMGLFLARVLRGSRITMQQTRVEGGIWLPERVEVRAAARIFFVKSLVMDRVLTYSEYKLAETDDPGRGENHANQK